MTTAEFVTHLQAVKRNGRGWSARCPAHEDRTPSLSLHEGERGLLLRCWAGCTVEEICQALGIRVLDLFYDADADPKTRTEIMRHSQVRREHESATHNAELHRGGIFREAETVIQAATNVDISQWTPDQLDRVMDAVAEARLVLIKEEDDERLCA